MLYDTMMLLLHMHFTTLKDREEEQASFFTVNPPKVTVNPPKEGAQVISVCSNVAMYV